MDYFEEGNSSSILDSEKYKQHKFDREYAAKYHKNPDVFAAHVNAQQLWAEKMQEKYNKENEEYQKKMKEKKERKEQELAEKYGMAGGHVLGGGKKDDSKPNALRPDYNPLMGAGNSSNYRPPRRSPCGGGGCGK
ncbi:selenoprotein S B-like [Asbolus verrucosus]|uniref:Selenoprotein S B-like n=1 Tax=Asbolus verrucosus TaxID=1661398 RepID=A0A482W4R9_ASBVE|nr:selenoprotein S B-like [Asbolus verrucosus]